MENYIFLLNFLYLFFIFFGGGSKRVLLWGMLFFNIFFPKCLYFHIPPLRVTVGGVTSQGYQKMRVKSFKMIILQKKFLFYISSNFKAWISQTPSFLAIQEEVFYLYLFRFMRVFQVGTAPVARTDKDCPLGFWVWQRGPSPPSPCICCRSRSTRFSLNKQWTCRLPRDET